jgi:hypothetical protein
MTALAVLLMVAAAIAQIGGVVRDSRTLAPVPGAIVTWQTTSFRTVTGADGSYRLPIRIGDDLVIVAAAKGYFNGWATVDPPALGVELRLDPVPTEDNPAYTLEPPDTCSLCHWSVYEDWHNTPMALAGTNTWVDDLYSGLGTPGGAGGFVYVRDSMYAAHNPNSECASCHQPEAWIAQPFSALQDPRQPRTTAALHGISCEVCHKIADVDVARINFPGIFPGAVRFTRPPGPDPHPVQYGVLGDTNYHHELLMRPSYQPQLVAEVCAACHQDANDPEENHTYTGVISEPTYTEWRDSPWSDPASPQFRTCVDCHMPPSGRDFVCEVLYPPLLRDQDQVRTHQILGTTPEFLENAVELSMTAARNQEYMDVQVDVANTLTGHHVPTGVTVRNMILLVEARRIGDDRPLRQVGPQIVHELGGVGDPQQGYFAGLPGKLYTKLIHDPSGHAPTFFTDAAGIVFDNRIAAGETDPTHYRFLIPGGGGEVRLRARLIYRRAFRALVDAKQWSSDGHGRPLEDIQPPHFGHLMELSEAVAALVRGDADGDLDADLADFARLAPCLRGPGLPPADEACTVLDDDGDADADLRDVAGFLTGFSEP